MADIGRNVISPNRQSCVQFFLWIDCRRKQKFAPFDGVLCSEELEEEDEEE